MDNSIEKQLNDDPRESSEEEDDEVKPKEYKINFWPAEPDIPKGFTFKSKSRLFSRAVESSKKYLKRRLKKDINGGKFEIVDVRKQGLSTELVVEVTDSKGGGGGIISIWGPNKNGNSTVMVKKIKEYEDRFVKIIATEIVQPILDCFIAGEGSENLFKKTTEKTIGNLKDDNFCDMCDKYFVSEKNLQVHVTRFHTLNAESNSKKKFKSEQSEFTPIKNDSKLTITEMIEGFQCDTCIKKFDAREKLNVHMDECHKKSDRFHKTVTLTPAKSSDIIDLSATLEEMPEDIEIILKNLETKSFEERRVDDQMMDTEEENVDSLEKEANYIEGVDEKEETKEETHKSKRLNDLDSLPTNLTEIPTVFKAFVNDGDMMMKVDGDGLCGINCGAAHIFGDPREGRKFRKVINRHIVDRWAFYRNKISFDPPYERQVGVKGDFVVFTEPLQYLHFLQTQEANLLWTDFEELKAMSNLYQMSITVLTLSGNNVVTKSVIGPDPEMIDSAILPPGKVLDMVLIHTKDIHFDLVVQKPSVLKNVFLRKMNEELISNDDKHETKVSDQANSEDRDSDKRKITFDKVKEWKDKYENLKEKFKTLELKHKSCKEQISVLEKQLAGKSPKRKKNKLDITKADDKAKDSSVTQEEMDVEEVDKEQEVWFTQRLSGFKRTNPQNEAELSLVCDLCMKIFKTKVNYEIHMKEHQYDYKCEDCNKRFKNKDSLKEHKKHDHNNVKEFQCNLCEFMGNSEENLREHVKEHQDEYRCENCQKRFENEDSLKVHKHDDHNIVKMFQCNLCEFMSNSEEDLTKHRSEVPHMTDIVECPICNSKFKKGSNIEKHVLEHSNEADWRCGSCSFQVNTISALRNHMELTCHKSGQISQVQGEKIGESLNCRFCEKTFMNHSDMMDHRRTTHKTYKPCRNISMCTYGDKCLYSHEKVDPNKFCCYECGEVFNRISDLMLHRKMTHQTRDCRENQRNNCPFTATACWFSHGKIVRTEKSDDSLAREHKSVFYPPQNLAPPPQATWNQMLKMFNQMKQIMETLETRMPELQL